MAASIKRKKKAAPPTREQRYAEANRKVGNALTIFETAVTGLDEAACEHDELIAELDKEITEMRALRAAAVLQSDNTREVAHNLRGLVTITD